MGLIGAVIQMVYNGGHCVIMSPIAFIQRPALWLEAISRYKAFISGGPNFAYDLCVRQTTPEQLQGIDLSHWQVAVNGSEPVRAKLSKDSLKYFLIRVSQEVFRSVLRTC